MKIIFASDHVGYAMKAELMSHVASLGHETADVGAFDGERAEYPVFGKLAAQAIQEGLGDLAVLICGTGCGIALAANKQRGVRCVNCSEPYTALLARRHNDANALALGARVVGVELAKMITETFLNGQFEGGRHAERVAMLEE